MIDNKFALIDLKKEIYKKMHSLGDFTVQTYAHVHFLVNRAITTT